MAPGRKTKSSSTRSVVQVSSSVIAAPSVPVVVPPQNSNVLGDDTSLEQSSGAGRSLSKRVRGKTIGKGIDKLIAQDGGEKLYVPVLEEWNSLCGINGPKASSLLGVHIRRMSPIKDTPTWRHIDGAIQSAIIQAVLDKVKISDNYHDNPLAQEVVHKKCYHLHINWRYRMKCHYLDLVERGVDPYTRPYDHLILEDWCHLIDDVWASDKHKRKSKAAIANMGLLTHSHCSGSRSFVVAITTPPENNGLANLDFPEFYEKTHTKKDKNWISSICSENHTKMLHLREESSQSGVQLTGESMSTQVLGKRNRYILGFGVGPQPISSSLKTSAASRARDEELRKRIAEMEKMQLEHEEEKREREEEKREREEERRERAEERKLHAAGQKELTELLRRCREKTQAIMGDS